MVPTQVWTGNSKNVVPERLMINVNLRFAPGRTAGDAERDLRELVRDDADVEVIDHAPAGAVYLGHPLIEPWRAREEIPIACKQAWTDVARFTERGIPAVNFGPGETAQAHQAGEWCSIDSLEFAYGALWSFFAE
jgi:succinyl-diaminopimelate desuccinylase